MELQEALEGISGRRFIALCNLRESTLKNMNVADKKYSELSPAYQVGLDNLLGGLIKVQSLVFYYDLQFVSHMMADVGIKIGAFYDRCGICPTFKYNKYLPADKMGERLIIVRMELIRMISRILAYMTE